MSKLSLKIVTFFVLLNIFELVTNVFGHGMMVEPVGRASRWRFDKTAKKNYNDNELFCGGLTVQWNENGGKCGICGDNYADPVPRNHELGGKYGEGIIVKTYKQSNGTIPVEVRLTAAHLGSFKWEICNIDKENETEECFAKNPLTLLDGSKKYVVKKGSDTYETTLKIPKSLKCKHCVLRWTYQGGNNWGICEDGEGALGCGAQENFRSCADISIE